MLHRVPPSLPTMLALGSLFRFSRKIWEQKNEKTISLLFGTVFLQTPHFLVILTKFIMDYVIFKTIFW